MTTWPPNLKNLEEEVDQDELLPEIVVKEATILQLPKEEVKVA